MDLKTEIFDRVKKLFSGYLEENNLRRTPERFAILEEIYNYSHHFNADALYSQMKDKKHRVSRATVYNTLELLNECNLVSKHKFGENTTYFEKSYSYQQHDHLICLDCKKVLDFCDPRLQKIKNTLHNLFSFEIKYHSLNIYGYCSECKNKRPENLNIDN
ncbi:MAG: Fur family transcriptional regulator [Solitalea-like symbiont of Tyrophagus putrescentiae]